MRMNAFVLKRPSPNSKGLACLRFEGQVGEPYPRDTLLTLKRDWHFFWFSSWNYRLKDIPYNDLIDLFIVWDDLAAEIRSSGRSDCIVLLGGCETAERHDLLFFPIQATRCDVDVLYVARFAEAKRCDVALKCVHYLAERRADVRAVFLESPASEPCSKEWATREIERLGLGNNLLLTTVPLSAVNSFLNRARISLFTSDDEGVCRAVLQSLLAERPLLCYRNTRALTRSLYDHRFFHYYDEQTEDSVGRAAWNLLESGITSNPGAREYVLDERKLVFEDFAKRQETILAASEGLYSRDGQKLEPKDVIPPDVCVRQAWRTFELEL